ncbi:MAG: acyl-CoA thioesterase [Elainella sp. Prado103]|nr:acyl-CoA thioesterase [Elainella sp. Prado103]
MQPFTTHLRVRHYEMDAQGHVNNAVYQHYLEQVAIEHSESLGFGPTRYRMLGGSFVMRRVTIDYLRPAFAGDRLALTTWLQEVRGTRALRRYEIRQADQADLLVTAEALWVWVDLDTMRPKAMPPEILEVFQTLITQTHSPIG